MATAIVAGVAALVRDLNPDLRGAEIVRLLKETARRAPGTGWTPELGWGIVDAAAALAARPRDRPPRPDLAPARAARAPVAARSRCAGAATTPRRRTSPPAGIARYEVWRSVDGLAPVRIFVVRGTAKRLRVRPGRRYAFFTVAVDGRGTARPAAPRRRPGASPALRRGDPTSTSFSSCRHVTLLVRSPSPRAPRPCADRARTNLSATVEREAVDFDDEPSVLQTASTSYRPSRTFVSGSGSSRLRPPPGAAAPPPTA